MAATVLPPGLVNIAYIHDDQQTQGSYSGPGPGGGNTPSPPSTAPVSVAGSRLNLFVQAQGVAFPPGGSDECGWLCLRPRCLQHARSPQWLLFWLCCAAAVQGMVVNGFVNVCITTIEKRYDLRSKDTGIVAGAYDMASVLCSVPVAYFGSRRGASKARWLGWGIIFMGLGSFVFALPHFVTPAYDSFVRASAEVNLSTIMCSHEAAARESCPPSYQLGGLSNFRHVFVLGQVLHGVGATPLYTLGVTYLDESVPVRMSSLYLGVFYAMAVVGPAIGYVVGGQFLNIYIDFPQDPYSLGVSPLSGRWLGAWWVGFLVSGCAAVLVAGPLLAFPAVLQGFKSERPHTPDDPVKRSSGAGTSAGVNAFQELSDFPSATRSLMSNITFVALSLAGATEGVLLAGFATFIPKFIESQFSVTASFSALVVGFVAVPAGGGGTLLGGWLIKKYEMTCSSILKLLFAGSVFCLLSCFGLLIYCPNHQFAGVDIHLPDLSPPAQLPSLVSLCNLNCSCRGVSYNPVCGANNVIYYSPCHAGCSSRHQFGDKEVFSNCSCIRPLLGHSSPHASSLISLPPEVPPDLLLKGLVLRDTCTTTCQMMPYFLFLFLVMMLFTFTISLPALSGTLRCVAEEQRSLALGVQWIIIRLLGTIPGPILLGSIIDYTCRLWQESCDVQGSCLSYNNFDMSRYMLGISFAAKALSSTLFLIAWWFFRPTKDESTPMSPVHPIGTPPPPSTYTLPPPGHWREGGDTPSHGCYSGGYDNPAVEIT